ncbi:hypothetical protein G6F16_000141 [Rhizopus arrhizus]|nr:hypothetical protein G6F23_000063 [Rhizopus arrhizus]KAG0770037.1 hypothetical protein G6F24_000575 [Rhizopus arrhizus]KAG0771689.1 hypothetical protein G6F22_016275 [Rhizopus arrhizus]KAG0797830.1 hypothetical protein G6F21_000224 [Rhizopus arrhizus]KAG0819952.1 hypothetical protein G6F20_000341 [Rhizopus arrhizus]
MSLWRRKAPVQCEVQLSERDAEILEIYTRRAKKFDEMFKVCCCWIGYDVLLEFIPIVACKAELPRMIKKRMLYHITVDFLLGLIPILGILLDMLYGAHSKNARILRKFLYERERQNNLKEAQEMALNVTKNVKPTLSEPTSVLFQRDQAR